VYKEQINIKTKKNYDMPNKLSDKDNNNKIKILVWKKHVIMERTRKFSIMNIEYSMEE
jgi:hypothetical protein